MTERQFTTSIPADDLYRMSPEEAANFYKKLCPTYDKEMTLSGYGGPMLVSQYLNKHASALGWKKDEVRILDVAAGTGAVGQVLKEKDGYANLDAVDVSPEMLEEARRKNIYEKLICSAVGGGVAMPIPDNTYDACIASGAFVHGHLSCDAVLEMMRVVKPGGLIVNVMRHEYTWTSSELCNLLPLYKQQVEEGKLKKLDQVVIPEQFFLGKDGLVQVYQVL